MDSISRSQLQQGDVFRRQCEEETYKIAVKKYTQEVVNVIAKDLVSQLNSRAKKLYVYRFGKPYIIGHPVVPPSKNNSLNYAYQNAITPTKCLNTKELCIQRCISQLTIVLRKPNNSHKYRPESAALVSNVFDNPSGDTICSSKELFFELISIINKENKGT